MQIIKNTLFILKTSASGLLIGFLILFFIPDSRMPFNWNSAKSAWQFYQQQQLQPRLPQKDSILSVENLSFSSAVQKAYPSVVSINAFRPKGLRNNARLNKDEKILDVGVGFGSGIILSEDGYIVTNHHVIAEADKISINLPDGRRRWVSLIGFDKLMDIAILKTDIRDIKPAELANSSEVRTGDIVMAIGSPFGSNQSVSLGIVSAIPQSPIEAQIQTDAAINSGNSGGPLINSRGQVIGINQMILASRGGGQTGINYAIPIDQVKKIVTDIITYGRVRRNWLGISAVELPLASHQQQFPDIQFGTGFFVNKVDKGSPSERAGIQVGDFITRFEEQNITGVFSFHKLYYDTPIGKEVKIELIRKEKTLIFKVQLFEQNMPEK